MACTICSRCLNYFFLIKGVLSIFIEVYELNLQENTYLDVVVLVKLTL